MENNLENLTIGVFARAAGVNVETIRFYQRKGLLPEPDRPYGSIRRYGQADVARVKFVKSAQRLGFSLDEIAELLKLEDGTHCCEAAELATLRLADVRARLLQRALAGSSQTGGAEILTRRLCRTRLLKTSIHQRGDLAGDARRGVEIDHGFAPFGSSHGKSSSRSANGLAMGSGVGAKPRTGGNLVSSWCSTIASV